MPQQGERVHAIQRRPAAIEKRLPVSEAQPSRSTGRAPLHGFVSERVASPVSEVVGGLPARLRAGVESLSGLAMDDVRVHRNSSEPAKLDALAFTRGTEIHLGPGQEQHLPHEAWHVVQQKQGRATATAQMKGHLLNGEAAFESEADKMGQMAVKWPPGRPSPTQLGPRKGGAIQVVQRQASTSKSKPSGLKERRDNPIDVIEAVVHVMSARGLAGDVGPKGENVSSPLYAPEVTKTIQEQEHKTLLWVWHLIAIGDPVAHGDRAKIAKSDTRTKRLIAKAKADPATRKRAELLEARYAAGVEELSQRAAREQVDEMLEAGVQASKNFEKNKLGANDDEQIQSAVSEAQKAVAKGVSVVRRLRSGATTAKQQAEYQALVYKRTERAYRYAILASEEPPLPWPDIVMRARGMNVADALFLLQGGLDAASAILAVSDPQAREDLFRKRSNYFGTVAHGATINKIFWQFVSGAITVAGAGAYAVTKLSGKTALAESILDATVKGISNVGAAINLAGVVHGVYTLFDPDATSDEKAEAAVEIAYSGVGLTGFAARWVPRLGVAARWSGPISASLAINFFLVKHAAGLRQRAEVGLTRADWVPCHQAVKRAAIEIQNWQRHLAVANAMLATETDTRRKVELQKYAAAFRSELIERQLKPFVEARLSSTSMNDDVASCGYAFNKRLAPITGLFGSASTSDDAALAASSTFLLVVQKAFAEWDQIVMDKSSP